MEINTFLDLCSGIGGGRLGLEQAGLKSTGYSDTSKLAVRTYTLMHNTTGEPYYYNLKKIKTEKLLPYDMLIAEVSDRHLLMQAGNAMTVNVIKLLGQSIMKFWEDNHEPLV